MCVPPQVNSLLGAIKQLGKQAKDGENAMAHLKKTKNEPKSNGGRGDLLSSIQQGIELKSVKERQQSDAANAGSDDDEEEERRRRYVHHITPQHTTAVA